MKISEIKIPKFSVASTKSFEENLGKKLSPQRSHANTSLAFGEAELKRSLGTDGHMTLPPTAKQKEGRRRVGNSFSKHCHIHRKCLKRDGSVNVVQTYFYHSIGKMPLYREDRIDIVTGMMMTCFKKSRETCCTRDCATAPTILKVLTQL